MELPITFEEQLKAYAEIEKTPSFIRILGFPNILPSNFGEYHNKEIFFYQKTEKPSELLKFVDSDLRWDYIILNIKDLPKDCDDKALLGLHQMQPYSRIGLLGEKNKKLSTDKLHAGYFTIKEIGNNEKFQYEMNHFSKSSNIVDLENKLINKIKTRIDINLTSRRLSPRNIIGYSKKYNNEYNKKFQEIIKELEGIMHCPGKKRTKNNIGIARYVFAFP